MFFSYRSIARIYALKDSDAATKADVEKKKNFVNRDLLMSRMRTGVPGMSIVRIQIFDP